MQLLLSKRVSSALKNNKSNGPHIIDFCQIPLNKHMVGLYTPIEWDKKEKTNANTHFQAEKTHIFL